MLAEERAEIYRVKKKARTKAAVLRVKKVTRKLLIEKWRERISLAEKGEWIRMLICDLDQWMSRSHGQMSFHLTQVLSGHGCFNEYLHRMRLKRDRNAFTVFTGGMMDHSTSFLSVGLGNVNGKSYFDH